MAPKLSSDKSDRRQVKADDDTGVVMIMILAHKEVSWSDTVIDGRLVNLVKVGSTDDFLHGNQFSHDSRRKKILAYSFSAIFCWPVSTISSHRTCADQTEATTQCSQSELRMCNDPLRALDFQIVRRIHGRLRYNILLQLFAWNFIQRHFDEVQ
ncbi:hypothetical protein ACTXT7_015423 [Hymenolepis weldensis]